jgi:proteasome accessory factor C
MPDGTTGTGGMRGGVSRAAPDQLERILFLLPAATREGGMELDELARRLDVTRKDVIDDITAVTARAFYHPAGTGSELQIYMSEHRVSIWTTGEFRRPVRLSLPEAVCLGLALRGARSAGTPTASDDGEEDHRLAGLERILASADPGDLLREMDATDLRPPGAAVRDTVIQGLREKTVVRLSYCKPGDEVPSDRIVHPYALAHGEGQWYLLGHCEQSGEVRVFRFDRMADAFATGTPFPMPADFDPTEFIQGHRVYRAEEDAEATVRYSPRIARWIAERESGEWDAEGGLTVVHRVADPRWLVRHVLQYGPDACILTPPEARAWVREAVRPWVVGASSGPTPPPKGASSGGAPPSPGAAGSTRH